MDERMRGRGRARGREHGSGSNGESSSSSYRNQRPGGSSQTPWGAAESAVQLPPDWGPRPQVEPSASTQQTSVSCNFETSDY